MVAHLVWDQGVAGSSPVFPTKAPAICRGFFVLGTYFVFILKRLKYGHYNTICTAKEAIPNGSSFGEGSERVKANDAQIDFLNKRPPLFCHSAEGRNLRRDFRDPAERQGDKINYKPKKAIKEWLPG